ncbi:peptidase insulinase family protein [Nitzschia inconspicua]|uniref:Peptidase insulinase family protein n=1 Tax=Nitzschia inconspicua TaxID=303405 RepID=A0A9K3M1D6_9STRA|nr:peptidase insulinase family protein [Nitzschia inconspicua]
MPSDKDTDSNGGATNVVVGPDLDSTRSPLDKKHYRQILLPNGLRAVLVSDVVAMTQAYNSGGLYDEEDNSDDEISAEEVKKNADDGSSSSTSTEAEHGLRDAAAAMLVGVGSLYDPPECQGMAHFLEHLLFMGSEKYPEENAYDKFMSKHGGSENAFTEEEHTVYHFEIPQEHLASALDMFAQFFIHPLMLESSVEREIQAIESEFQLVKNSDSSRASQLMKYTCGRSFEEHPFSKFGWGNYKSLKEIPAQNEVEPLRMMREFFNEHYYASNMRLVVVGGYTLDYLEEHVIKSFSPIRSKDPLGSYTWSQTFDSPIKKYGLPLAAESMQNIFYMAPVRDRHSLSLTWQIPSQIDNWRSKPCDYISHLIGHEGEGSLLASLKSKSWATACCAGVGDGGEENASSHAFFQVSFALSEEGMDHWEEVVSELYQYVGMLRYHCQEGLPEWMYEELGCIYEVAHKYADEEPPEDFAVSLAEEMSPWWNTPPDRLLDASGLYFEYNPELIRKIVDEYFCPSNARIVLSSTLFGRSGEYEEAENTYRGDCSHSFKFDDESFVSIDKTFDPKVCGAPHIEPYFGTPFWIQKVSEEQIRSWSACAKPGLPPPGTNISLPQPNEFIPTNFDLKPLPETDCDHPLLNCSIKLQTNVGKRKQWFPATVTQYNSVKNEILCHYEDEHQRWHQMDVQAWDLVSSNLTSSDFEGTLDKKTIKYRVVSVAIEGEKASMKFGDETDLEVECGKAFPSIPPAASPSRLPVLLMNTNELKFWHLQDRKFKRPIADLRLNLNCIDANKTALHSACADILVNLVSEHLTEVAYMASVCELGSALSANDGGFSVRVHGFDDKLLTLFLIMLETFLRFRSNHTDRLPDGFCEQRFKLVVEKYIRGCHNSDMKASKLSSSARIRCLRPGSYSARQKLKAIERISIPTFSKTISGIMKNVGAEGFFHGNIDTAGAIAAKDKILSLLRSGSNGVINGGLSRKKYPPQYVLRLPSKPCSVLLATKDPTETNAAVELYLQVGKDNTFDRVMVDVLMELMYEPMYNQIRTLDGFGYSVSCDARWTNGIVGMHFCVVSPSKTAQEIEARIDRFLLEYRKTLTDMSSEEFMEHLIGLATEKLNMFHSLSEETDHFWSEIRDGRYNWEVERDEVICLKTITKEQTLKAYDEWINPENKKRKKLVIKVVASEGPAAEGRPDVKQEDVEDFNDKCVNECHAFCKNQTFGRIY